MRAILISILLLLTAITSMQAQNKDLDLDSKSPEMRDVVYDGIDVSSYQEDIDWTATASDKKIKFVYVKATEGTSYKSRHYQYNIENARKQGIRVGSYHFYRPHIPVIKQFQNFTSIVKLEDQDLVPLIDIETKGSMTGAQVADSVLAFAKMLERHYGCRPMIYTGSSFYNSYLRGRFTGYKLFIARYSKFPPRLAGTAKWTLWQFSERGRIAGIDAYVDLCRFNTGCGLSDILIPGRRRTTRHTAADVPERKVTPKTETPVPLSKKEQEKQRKAKEKAQKEAQKQAHKQAEQKRKQAEKAREQARKKAEQEAKDKAKREAEAKKAAEKKRESDRKAMEQQQAQQEKARKQAAKEAEASRKQQESTARRQQQQSTSSKSQPSRLQNQSANQKAKKQGKRINQSSADNDDDVYMPVRKKN